MRDCEVVIVIPTLNPVEAANTANLARQAAGMPCGILIASDQEKRGAVHVGNVLLQAAMGWGAEYVCYLNDDVSQFTVGWLKTLVDVAKSSGKYADVSAMGKCRGGPQPTGKPGEPFEIVETRHPLAWFCTVLQVDALRRVGLFDERFIHYADDSELSYRLLEAGYKHVCVRGVWVQHNQDAEPIRQWWEHDLNLLRQKWNHLMK